MITTDYNSISLKNVVIYSTTSFDIFFDSNRVSSSLINLSIQIALTNLKNVVNSFYSSRVTLTQINFVAYY